jgi:hypothetical protein
VLTPEERSDVLSKFPDKTQILNAGTPDARPNTVSLRNDDNFRYDCARYRENLELGRHDEEWLAQAWTAHEKHKRGDYDEFLRKQFEEDWGIELPKDITKLPGETIARNGRGGSKDAEEPKTALRRNSPRDSEQPESIRKTQPISQPENQAASESLQPPEPSSKDLQSSSKSMLMLNIDPQKRREQPLVSDAVANKNSDKLTSEKARKFNPGAIEQNSLEGASQC